MAARLFAAPCGNARQVEAKGHLLKRLVVPFLQGSGSTTVIAFPPAAATFIRITQTGTAADNAPWSMQRLRLFAAPARGAGGAVR